MGIRFNNKEIVDAEKYYGTIHISERQKTLLEPVAKIISDQINVSERAVKGFLWRAVREWQMENKKDLSEAEALSPDQRVLLFKKIMELIKHTFTRILIDNSQEHLLDKALNDVLSIYKTRYLRT
ncbi:MAG: hypothetical protein ACFFCV_21345 [Promethearchaeota archaeon]